MKSKVLFIILFSLILIGFLYITTIYAEELQSLNSQNTPAYTGNVVSTSTAVNIKYSTFNGTYSNSKSFSFSYPQGWKAIISNSYVLTPSSSYITVESPSF